MPRFGVNPYYPKQLRWITMENLPQRESVDSEN
jgi:hypothetical protein